GGGEERAEGGKDAVKDPAAEVEGEKKMKGEDEDEDEDEDEHKDKDKDKPDLLPHEELFSKTNTADVEQIQELLETYDDYAINNVMRQITEGMMSIHSTSPDDPVDALADYLITKGKELEAEGNRKARENFDGLLAHVEELSSRMFDARTEGSTFATGFSSVMS
ncbi:hypothetical protein ScalyP_jg9832, partial [Parmales sp. scaly parma]